MGDLGQTNCKPTITARRGERGEREAKCTRQKKLKQNKAKTALKQRKANSQKLEQKANKQKTNTAKKATHQQKKKNEMKRNQKTQAKGQQTEGERCTLPWQRGIVEQVAVDWGKVARTSSISTANFCTLKRFTQIQSLNQ